MDRSIFRIKRTKTLHQDWKHKKSAELEKQRRDFLEEKRKLEEDRRNFEREKREFFTHCQLEKDSMKREKQLFETKWKILEEELFQLADEKLKVGSYLRIADTEDAILIATIENFTIEVDNNANQKYLIEAKPLGMIRDGKFERGGDTIAIPPKSVEPATQEDIKKIFEDSLEDKHKFIFGKLSNNASISIPVDGNRFFNKHIAIVGSTGSGKSHSVAKIIQKAIDSREGEYNGLNNSHIVIFDIHSEYKTAFPKANMIDVNNLVLPYWLLNSDELQEMFLDTEANDHNQRNVFKQSVVDSRKNNFTGDEEQKKSIHFDSPLYFDIDDVLETANKKNKERIYGNRC